MTTQAFLYKLGDLLRVPADDPLKMCADHDDECPLVPDKVACWLYMPEKGYCPYLKEQP